MAFSLGILRDKGKIRNSYDLIIIGGGPAGLTAAIYARRSGLDILVIEPMITGGNIVLTEMVDNWPGDFSGVTGEELGNRMTKHAKRFGTDFLDEDIESVKLKGAIKVVSSGNREYTAESIIIAAGTHPKAINVPGEEIYKGHGISYCATCDAPFFKGKDIVVIGAGNSAIEESLYLLNFVKSITFVQDLPFITADKIIADEIKSNQNVKFHFEHLVKEFKGNDGKLSSVIAEDRKTGELKEIKADGCFVYIGLIPNTDLFVNQIKLNEYGYIVAGEDTTTSEKGVFVAGDVRGKLLRQIVTAVSDGAVAAFQAKRYIDSIAGGDKQCQT